MTSSKSALMQAYLTIKELKAKLSAAEQLKQEPIAIIGMGCRFPGADNPEAFWRILRDGVDTSREVPADRWDINAYYNPEPDVPGKMYVRRMAFLEQVDTFDASFFGIAPREALSLDPRQRLLLEVSWEAMENAGIAPGQLRESQTGVYIGVDETLGEYALSGLERMQFDPYMGTGNGIGFPSGRLSYTFGLQGPSMSIATACSSSLVALHVACQNLILRECNLALAGGVHLNLLPDETIQLCKLKALAPDGRCKTFDAAADGFARGEGCGVIVLKRLSDAKADGDPILAVIRGSAVNHDGPSAGFTVPNGVAQEKLLSKALAVAGVAPVDLDYVEAHGTGTPLGDPIEVQALAKVLSVGRDTPLLIGSVKTNIGHLEEAAGIAGLIKIVLSFQQGEIPPNLHFKQPNPHIPWSDLRVKVPTERTPWLVGKKKIAGVSSFGMTGTNAHMILEEAPAHESVQPGFERPRHLFCLSAKTKEALGELVERYKNHLSTHRELSLADVCFTANAGRTHFDWRLAITADSLVKLHQKLVAHAEGQQEPGIFGEQVSQHKRPKVAFLFTGQGSQYVNMGRSLFETQPTFRHALERCAEILRPCLNKPLLEILYPQNEQAVADTPLNETAHAQPALFALEYALAQLWQSWGVKPHVLVGHSVGEYVAACLAGVFSLEDGLKLIAERGRLMQALPPGGQMVAVMLSEEHVIPLIRPHARTVSIAAVNGPQSTVISGRHEAIDAICATLTTAGVKIERLTVSHAFHSPLLEPMLADFERVAQQVNYSKPQIKLISNVTGELANPDEVTTADYWVRHARQPVRFADGMQALKQQGADVIIEMGSKPILLGLGQQCLPNHKGLWLSSLRPNQEDWRQLLSSLAALYIHGMSVDWPGFDQDYARQRIALPTYPFQRQRYWIETTNDNRHQVYSQQKTTHNPDSHPLLGQRLSLPGARELRFQSQISPDAPAWLKDHHVFQMTVVPGTAYLDMALSAGASVAGSRQLELNDVVYQQALTLSESSQATTVQLVLVPETDERYSFRIFSLPADGKGAPNPAEDWILHASGKLLVKSEQCMPERVDLSALRQQCTEEIPVEIIYQRCRDQGIEYGSSFLLMEHVWRDKEDFVLGKVRLPSASAMDAYQLHPVLLDACNQVLDATLLKENPQSGSGALLPSAVKYLHFHKSPTDLSVWCCVQRVGESAWDFQIVEETGELIAEIRGFWMRPVSSKQLLAHDDPSEWFYRLEWQPQPLNIQETSTIPGTWLIFSDPQGIGKAVAARLEARNQHCVLIFRGEEYTTLADGQVMINPSASSEFQRLIREHLHSNQPSCRGVVYLWGSDREDGYSDVPDQAYELVAGALHLVQALTEFRIQARLWLMTRGTQPVFNSKVVNVAQAPVWGLGRTIMAEYPELSCVCADLGPGGGEDEPAQVLAELLASSEENQVALHAGKRYIARLVSHGERGDDDKSPNELSDKSNVAIGKAGCYLITGGLGGLGLKAAQWLVSQGASHLVLTSRHGAVSPESQEIVQALQEAGVFVTVVKADIAHAEDVKTVIQACQARVPLRGIIHAAGLVDDGVLQGQTADRFRQVMAPKVQGAWLLHTLTQEIPLDFFVCFSSSVSLLSYGGQGNYAAGNAFMDALAHYRHGVGLPSLSINWGAWSEVGLAARIDKVHKDRLQTQGDFTISPEQGVGILGRLIKQASAQVGVLPIDWAIFLRRFSGIPPLFLSLRQATSHAGLSPTEQGQWLSHFKNRPIPEVRGALLKKVTQVVRDVLELDSDTSFDPEQRFYEMGMDSLMSIEVRNQLQKLIGQPLSTALVFEHPSITAVVDHLMADILPATYQASPAFSEKTDQGEDGIPIKELLSEAVLDPSIPSVAGTVDFSVEPKAVFLTGATGFVGAFLLVELLQQTPADIYCLVRGCDSVELARRKIHENMAGYGLQWEDDSRIIPVMGDLTQPLLGMKEEAFDQLAGTVEVVYHAGTLVNFAYPYGSLKAVNVQGTHEVLRLAGSVRIKPVHYMSSVATLVAPGFFNRQSFRHNVHLEENDVLYGGYGQSKWVAEKLIELAHARGIPTTVYRPSMVSGHCQTGAANVEQIICRLLKAFIQLGSVPDLDILLPMTPVDYVSQAVVHLSRRQDSVGQIFNLVNPHSLPLNRLARELCLLDYPVKLVEFPQWEAETRNAAGDYRNTALNPIILPMVTEKLPGTDLTFMEVDSLLSQLSCENVLAGLADTSIVCPPVDGKLLGTYASYLIQQDFQKTDS